MNGTDAPPEEQPSAEQAELKPEAPGTYYGELSPRGRWLWEGRGQPDDAWIAKQQDQVEVFAAPTPGTAIAGTATIDSLFTLAFGTRSADLSAAPTYSWSTGNQIVGQWPAVANNYSAIFCTFNARQIAPSTISQ